MPWGSFETPEDSHRYLENVSKSYLITLSDVATALCAVRERGLRMPCYDASQGRGYSIYETATSEFVGENIFADANA